MAKITDYLSIQGAGYQLHISVKKARGQEVADALEVGMRDQPMRSRSALVCDWIVAQAKRQAAVEICPRCELEVDEVIPLPACDGEECYACMCDHVLECGACRAEIDKWEKADYHHDLRRGRGE